MTRRMKIDDLTDLAVPSQPALSPDGDRVVYVLRTLDTPIKGEDRNVDQLWTVPTSGGTPRRLTTGSSDTSPVWSPDGSKIAFLRDGQVHLLPIDGGEPERVTDLALGAGTPAWSPDGARLAFAAPVDPGTGGPLVADRLDYQADGSGMFGAVRSQVHVVDLDSGECTQVTDGTEHAGAPVWSPDGTTIAFTRSVGEDSDLRFRIAVHLLDMKDPKALPRVLAFADGVARTASYSADGESLLVVGWSGDPVGHARLFRVPLDGGAPVDLTGSLDRNVMPGAPAYPGGLPQEGADGRILFCLRERGCTHLWSIAADGSDARAVLDGAGRVVSGLSVAGDLAVVALGTPTSYGEPRRGRRDGVHRDRGDRARCGLRRRRAVRARGAHLHHQRRHRGAGVAGPRPRSRSWAHAGRCPSWSTSTAARTTRGTPRPTRSTSTTRSSRPEAGPSCSSTHAAVTDTARSSTTPSTAPGVSRMPTTSSSRSTSSSPRGSPTRSGWRSPATATAAS